jgi:sugar lactone lactonase YvrE
MMRCLRILIRKPVLCALFIGGASFTVSTLQAARRFGHAQVFARVPTPPGFPEGIAVNDNKVYVAGPATLTTVANSQSSAVVSFSIVGALLAMYPTQGEDLNQLRSNACIAFDSAGRLYVVNAQLGVYRLNLQTGQQQSYGGPFPNLPSCLLSGPGTACSPTPVDLPPLPNDIVFDEAGNAYVTDSMQATIWRIPPGGGAPKIWFQDSRFAGPYIGLNGLTLDPTHRTVYLSVTHDLLAQGYVYTLPLVEQPNAADLKVFHHFALGEGPDGLAFGASGRLYVALATPARSGISILRANGTEERRLANPLLSPLFPYDSPANIAFNGQGSLLVTNHAFVTGALLPSQFTILDVFVNDTASPLVRPVLP